MLESGLGPVLAQVLALGLELELEPALGPDSQ